ncbi:Reverse transcriptase domain [Trinorchestia longiramus]|nr:Reverse transcriptase domain [Trinorchestia longiramus]
MLCLFIDFSSAFDIVWPMGVLYKLNRCRIWGTMLRCLQAYLKDRPFKVFMEGTYSSERIARSGVPQRAVLSPLLFNIMMYDTPVEEGICLSSELTGKGRHLLKIRDNTVQWLWSAHKTPNIETAFARLRVGHTEFRSRQYRFSIVEDLNCSCGAEEIIDHLFPPAHTTLQNVPPRKIP